MGLTEVYLKELSQYPTIEGMQKAIDGMEQELKKLRKTYASDMNHRPAEEWTRNRIKVLESKLHVYHLEMGERILLKNSDDVESK